MKVKETIEKRRAYRSLKPVEITDKLIKDLAYYASLAPSCYNRQPWRYVFVRNKGKLKELFQALSKGNEWAMKSSLVVAVCSKDKFDCIIGERRYYLFDTGLSVAFMILRATELGLVAHPIAGYDPEKVKDVLNIPEDLEVITLIIIGKHSEQIDPELSDYQRKAELTRPERKKFNEFAFIDQYSEK